jgi:phospholipase/carboxylesterase
MDKHERRYLSRRRIIGGAAAIVAALLTSACRIGWKGKNDLMARVTHRARRMTESGHLQTRPGQPVEDGPRGLQPLGLETGRDGLLYVPEGYQPDHPAPLIVMLHGAGGNAQGGIAPFQGLAEASGCILLAPESRDRTWDVILSDFGPDVAFIDRALAQTFGRYAIDPARCAVEGFSDGASYALSLGITNGDLFTHLIAFSPGFLAPEDQRGTPRIYISHGTSDAVLPIDQCSRRIVPRLKGAGYDVNYHEFDGPHTVTADIAGEGLDWFLGGPPPTGGQ